MNDETFQVTLDAWLAGELDEHGRARLDALLEADADSAGEFAAQHSIHLGLRTLMGGPGEDRRVIESVSAVLHGKPIEQLASAVTESIRNGHGLGGVGGPIAARRTRRLAKRPARRPDRAQMAAARPRGWWLTGMAAALLIGLGALVMAQFRKIPARDGFGRPIGHVLEVAGQAEVRTAGAAVPATRGQALRGGERLATGAGAGALLVAVGKLAQVRLFANGVLGMDGATDGGTLHQLTIEKGRAAFEVRAMPGLTLAVATPHARIRVRGTRFEVDVAADATRVAVEAGVVDVLDRGTGKSVILAAGACLRTGGRPRSLGHDSFDLAGLLALYTFDEGHGVTVRDVSGVGEPLDLTVEAADAIEWLPGGGLRVRSPVRIASAGPATKIVRGCRQSHALTVEAWIAPADAAQGLTPKDSPVRIVTLSLDCIVRNFTLAQHGSSYVLRLRTTGTSGGGDPSIATDGGVVTTRLTHLVATCDGQGRRRLFVDGALAAEGAVGGDLSNWDEEYPLVLARENRPDTSWLTVRPWLGEFHRVAIYDRALTPEEIDARYRGGPRFLDTADSHFLKSVGNSADLPRDANRAP